jgi:hypothetical protein
MTMTLTDLDDLALTVRDRNSRSYIAEAITAYRAGALRSAIISTWIAVAYDLYAKIRELAAQGDADAKAFVKELDAAIDQNSRGEDGAVPRLQKIENSLLDKAQEDFEFLSRQEHTDLKRLKEDRNLCAHPAFTKQEELFQPSPEQVRTHITHAITHLLQHPPVQGKNALARLKQDLLQASFPQDDAAVSAFMRSKYFTHIKDSLLDNFITVFLKILIKGVEPDLKGRETSVLRCLAAAREYSPARYEAKMAEQLPRLAEDLEDPKLRRVIRLFGMEPRCWRWLSRALHMRFQTIVKAFRYAEDGSRDYIFEGLVIDELRPLLLDALGRLEQHEQIAIIARRPHPEFADAAIAIYRSAGGWREAESLAKNLILPLADCYTAEHIGRIVEAILANSQIREANDSPQLVAELFQKTARIHPAAIVHWEELAQGLLDNRKTYSALTEAMREAGMTLPTRRTKRADDD